MAIPMTTKKTVFWKARWKRGSVSSVDVVVEADELRAA